MLIKHDPQPFGKYFLSVSRYTPSRYNPKLKKCILGKETILLHFGKRQYGGTEFSLGTKQEAIEALEALMQAIYNIKQIIEQL